MGDMKEIYRILTKYIEKSFTLRDPSKSLCFKIFGSRSTFTTTTQFITAII
jgi:hypothetical protein